MDEQRFRAVVRDAIPVEIEEVTVTALSAHADLGVLVEARAASGRELELKPLWCGRLFSALRVGDSGLALFARGESNAGYYLGGEVVKGILPAGYDPEVDLLDARGDLKIDAVGTVQVRGGTKGAARVDDPVEITIDLTDAVALQKLAAALLTTLAFLPSGTLPIPATTVTAMTFSGRITAGSESVKVGD